IPDLRGVVEDLLVGSRPIRGRANDVLQARVLELRALHEVVQPRYVRRMMLIVVMLERSSGHHRVEGIFRIGQGFESEGHLGCSVLTSAGKRQNLTHLSRRSSEKARLAVRSSVPAQFRPECTIATRLPARYL